MSTLNLAKVLVMLAPLFGNTVENHSLEPIKDDLVIYQGKTVKIIVPDCPIAEGSVKIIPSSGIENFSEWRDCEARETYELIQQVVRIWKEKGITNYLVYGKESNNSKSPFGWEVVPYPSNGLRFWKQFKVLWHITFGGACLPQIERHKIAKNFLQELDSFSCTQAKQIESIDKAAKGNDAFCNPVVIQKQLVFEGKEVNVLYNYAPLVLDKEKLHFLVIPKQHRPGFSDLTESEYLESLDLSQKLVNFYKGKGYHTTYLFNNTGKEAGQSVPHWHQHLVFTATKTQEFFVKLTVLKKMLFGASPLPSNELQMCVESLSKELKCMLNEKRGMAC
jgi:diadenosine tetraphosphate (Ap4A) HIT family hydrolase